MLLAFNKSLITACIVSVSLLSTSGPILAADNLMIITEDYPPLNFVENGVLRGPSVDIVKAIQDRLNIKNVIKVYPWARGYHLLKTKTNTALFSTTLSKKREGLFKWVGPIAEKKIGFFAKKSRGIRLKSLADAQGFMIGVQRDGVGMQLLEEWGHKKIDASTGAEANLKKLMGGRNDLWFSSNATVAGNSKKLNIDVNELEQVLVIDNTFMYIAFNEGTSDEIINLWQDTYDALVKEGVVKNIFQQHDLKSLYPTFH